MEEKEQHRAASYRRRADELKAVAATTRGTGTRVALLSLARGYLSMAEALAHFRTPDAAMGNGEISRDVESEKRGDASV